MQHILEKSGQKSASKTKEQFWPLSWYALVPNLWNKPLTLQIVVNTKFEAGQVL